MEDHPPCSTLILKEFPALKKGGETSHDNHQGFHQEPPRSELLHPSVRHLVGRHPHRGRARSWGVLGHPTAVPEGDPVRSPADGSRPRCGWHPVDGPPLWKGWPSRVSIALAQVAGWCSLVRCGAPYSPARVRGGICPAVAHLPRVPAPHLHH